MPFATKKVRDRRRAQMADLVKGGTPCHWCHQQIDLTLKWPDPFCLTADHLMPTTMGGSDDLDNIVPAHSRCNIKRQNKLYADDVSYNSGVLKL